MRTRIFKLIGMLLRDLPGPVRKLEPATGGKSSMLPTAAWMLGLCITIPATTQSQERQPGPRRSERVVAAAPTDRGVRFTAAASDVVAMRLEVYSAHGLKVFDSDFQRGGVLDWVVSDSAVSGRLSDDEYLCLVTLRDLSGQLQQRRGIASVTSGTLSLRPGAGPSRLSTAQITAMKASREAQLINEIGWEEEEPLIILNNERSPLIVTAHDGDHGQLTSTKGALTFRTGDVFSGNEIERVRIAPDGNVGIGTTKPKATLDVAGTIRATGPLRAAGGIEFADGSRLNSSAGKLVGANSSGEPQVPVDGTGTTGRLTKWTNGAAGTLGDSVVTETSGKLGIGTATPNYEITLFGNDVGLQLISSVTGTTATDGFRFGISSTNNAFLWNTEATDLYFGTSATERMRIKATGNVGIGTGNPTAALDVVGNINSSGAISSATASITGNLTVDTNTLHVDATNNRIGVGTTTPTSALDVVGNINTSTQFNIGGNRVLSNAGVSNLFAGVGAGTVNTGANNAFFGSGAGSANTTGSLNSLFGYAAGNSNTTGTSNAFFGASAGAANTTAGNNAFFGYFAGSANTIASFNSFFGSGAGQDNTTGGSNSFFGWNAGAKNTTGLHNSFFGMGAGILNTTGASNAFFGKGAGGENTTASNNSFFGASAGFVNTTGANNSFFGGSAGAGNTTGTNNSFFGKSAGALNTTASNNSFFGESAGASNTTGASNSFFGKEAGVLNTTGGSNAFFGTSAGASNTSGSSNSMFGSSAGDSNTTGLSNSFFGNLAGGANTTGGNNSFFGAGAGLNNTTAASNSFFGHNTGAGNTTGTTNSFFGAAAGQNNSTGSSNSFFGNDAGQANTTASNNSFFGNSAGKVNTTGVSNSFFGAGAGESNTAGSSNALFGTNAGTVNTGGANAFFGAAAGQSNTVGGSNAFFGQNSGGDNTTGFNNAFFGRNAGPFNTQGGDNTFVGHEAGLSNTTETDNTFVGAFSNGAAGITNATAIGANAIVTQSDSLVLGNNVKVGIGSAAPAEKLQVNGNIFVGGNPAAGANGVILKSPNGATCAKLTIDNAGALVTAVIACP